MSSILSFLIFFGLGSILVVGIGIVIQLSRSKDNQREEKDSEAKNHDNGRKKVAVEQITKADR